MGGELVKLTDPDEISQLPVEQRGEMITAALVESKAWLAVATMGTDPTPIAEFKIWAATVAEMAKQKGLAEQIQFDALEMVRRAERGIGLAIRNGQKAGAIKVRGQRDRQADSDAVDNGIYHPRPVSDFVSPDELTANGSGIYHLADGVTDERFDEALTIARDERNLSRANVVRKIEGDENARLTRPQKAAKIEEMAAAGYTSRQMVTVLVTSDTTIREIARDFDVDIPADRAVGKTRHIDPERILNETVSAMQGIEFGVNLLDQADFDSFTPEQVKAWLSALSTPLKAVQTLSKELKRRGN